MYLFGFGSLINIKSAQKSFKNRVLKKKDLIVVSLLGYKRVWNSIENVIFTEKEEKAVFLNIEKDNKSKIYGVLIKINEDEFELLKQREKNYTCIKIDKNSIENLELSEDIYAFMTTNEEKIAKKDDKDVVIPQKYIEILEEALEDYNEEFRNNFKICLENFPFPIAKDNYKFSDPIQNSASGRE